MFQFTQCNKDFSTNSNLVRHVCTIHTRTQHTREECNKPFTRTRVDHEEESVYRCMANTARQRYMSPTPLFGQKKTQYSARSLVASVEKAAYLNLLFRSHRIKQKDDMILWRIPNYALFSKLSRLSNIKQFRSITSPVFVLPLGHSFRIKLFADGAGKSRGTHLSVYVQMVSTDDHNVVYPFRGVLSFVVIDQTSGGWHQSSSIKASGNNPCFQQPTAQFNQENGVEALAPRGLLVFKDTLILGVSIRYNTHVV
jgi:hypothetical protein